MGNGDRIIRSSFAVLVLGLSLSGIIHGPLGFVLLGLSVVFLITSLYAVCPLYTLLGIRTCRKNKKAMKLK